MEDKKILNDKEVENVIGGANVIPFLSSAGGICPINGKYCKHGMSSHDGRCLKARIGKNPNTISLDKDGNEVIGSGETSYDCDYINDQE